jgi:hypothetical protein
VARAGLDLTRRRRPSLRAPRKWRAVAGDAPPFAQDESGMSTFLLGSRPLPPGTAEAPSRPDLTTRSSMAGVSSDEARARAPAANAEADASRRRSGRRREAAQQRRQRSSCREPRRAARGARILALDADEHDQLCLGMPSWRSTYLTRLRRREAELRAREVELAPLAELVLLGDPGLGLLVGDPVSPTTNAPANGTRAAP